MRIRFSITAMLLCVALFAAGVAYWKSQQPKGIHGAGYRPTVNSVHFIIESFSDQQQIELVLQKNGADDPKHAPIPITLSAGQTVELLFQNEKFYWFDARIHSTAAPQLLKDITAEIQAGGAWIATPISFLSDENRSTSSWEAIIVVIGPDIQTNSIPIKYAIVVRKASSL